MPVYGPSTGEWEALYGEQQGGPESTFLEDPWAKYRRRGVLPSSRLQAAPVAERRSYGIPAATSAVSASAPLVAAPAAVPTQPSFSLEDILTSVMRAQQNTTQVRDVSGYLEREQQYTAETRPERALDQAADFVGTSFPQYSPEAIAGTLTGEAYDPDLALKIDQLYRSAQQYRSPEYLTDVAQGTPGSRLEQTTYTGRGRKPFYGIARVPYDEDLLTEIAGPAIGPLETVQEAAGDVGEFAGQMFPYLATGGPLGLALQYGAQQVGAPSLLDLSDEAGDVGRVAAEAAIPTRPGEIALELLPGIGTVPGVASQLGRVAARQGVARQSPTLARIGAGLLDVTGTADTGLRNLAELTARRVPAIAGGADELTGGVNQLARTLEADHPGLVLEITDRSAHDAYRRRVWNIDAISLPAVQRNQGVGTEVMQRIVEAADEAGAILTLRPSLDFGATSISRLQRFYSRFGFRRNVGARSDDALPSGMFRSAKKSAPTSRAADELSDLERVLQKSVTGKGAREVLANADAARQGVGEGVATVAEMRKALDAIGESSAGTPSEIMARYRNLRAALVQGGVGTPSENVGYTAKQTYQSVLEQTGDPEAARLAARKAAAQETASNRNVAELSRLLDEQKEKARSVFGAAVDLPPVAGGARAAAILDAEQTKMLAHFTDMTKGVIDNESRMQGVYDAMRPFTRYVSGDVADSQLAEILAREAELRTLLTRRGVQLTDAQLDAVVKAWREGMVKRTFEGERLKSALETLAERSKKLYRQKPGMVDEISETLRGTLLNADFAVVGQQLEASVRRGSVPTLTGMLADSVNRIAAKLHLPGLPEIYLRSDIDHVSQLIADGLQMSGGKTADINMTGRSLFGRIPKVGTKVEAGLDALADVQFGNIMGTVRLRAAEGLLMQNKILHALSRGVVGGDITDPLVRRHIMETANTIGSTSRAATGATRSGVERAGVLSTRMTRAQINEVLTPLRSFRSAEDVLNTMNLIGSFALFLAAGKALNDQFGITPFELNPLEYGFGQITLDAKDSKGRNQIIDLFPQASFSKALTRSIAAFQEQDWKRLADTWQRYGFGRLNILPSGGLRFVGFGYDTESKFHGIGLGDERIPLGEAAKANIPAPLTFSEIAKDPSAVGIASAITGQSAFPESVYGGEDRLAQELFGGEYQSLSILDQAAVHVEMDKQGIPIESWRRVGPYWGADDKAYELLKEKNELFQQFATLDDFRKAAFQRFKDAGATDQEATNALRRMENDLKLTEYTRAVRKAVVARDPRIVEALQEMYEAGDLTFPPAKWLTDFVEELQAGGGE